MTDPFNHNKLKKYRCSAIIVINIITNIAEHNRDLSRN